MSTDSAPPQSADPSRRLRTLGLVLAVLISLAATCYPVFDRATQEHYATEPDANNIAGAAATATWGDAAGWWTGAWIEPRMPYYRPLPSLLFWAEYSLFGRDFQKYSVVSWLVNAGCSAILFLLALSLLRDRPPKLALALGLLAVFLFNTRRNIAGPGWEPYPIAWSLMPYWPSQTDLFSLLFSLLSLRVLDRYAEKPTRRRLAGAVGLYAVGLLCKEMTIALALLGPLWVWYRRRKMPWEVAGIYLGLGLAFLAARSWLVPGAWGPESPVAMKLGAKLLFYLNYELFYAYGGAGIIWPIPTAWGLLAMVWALRRYGKSLIWLLPGGLIWTILMCQLLGFNFTDFTLPKPLGVLALSLVFWGGLVVLGRSRSRLNWTLVAMVAVVHVPILHVIGPHYQYWPAAFWSLLGVALLLSAGDWWRALGSRRKTAREA